ncbi:MAG: hypothetical protein V4444_04615 [Pseudomonadota bacterium]
MPAKRRVSKVRDHRITDAAVAAFKANDEEALSWALGQKPWEYSPLEAEGECPHGPMHQQAHWAKAKELRAALEAAANAQTQH